MPGRVLGAGVDTSSLNDGVYRSVKAVDHSKNLENTLSESRKRLVYRREQPVRQSTPTSASPLERDKTERAAWANRVGAGRPPTRNGYLQLSPSPGESACSPDELQQSERGERENRDSRDNKRSEKSAKTAMSAILARPGDDKGTTMDRAVGSYQGDPVARAFKRYALHRDREEKLRRPSPEKLKAFTARSPPHGRGRWVTPPKNVSPPRNDAEGREDNSRSPPQRRQRRSPTRQQLRWTDDLDHDDHLETRDEEGRDYDSPGEGHVFFRRQVQPQGVSRSLHGHTWPWVSGGDEEGGGTDQNLSTNLDNKLLRPRLGSWESSARSIRRPPERDPESDGEEEVGSEGQRALRRAFDMYDVNGDGFITHLEVMAFLNRTRIPRYHFCFCALRFHRVWSKPFAPCYSEHS